MSRRVLVTGGAGFIGRHVAGALLERDCEVRILDCFHSQIHGSAPRHDEILSETEIVEADIRDSEAVGRALAGVDEVVHLAAEVGVGQSMYEIDRYVGANDLGAAILFQHLIRTPVRRVVTASSMSIYGEGLYRTADGGFCETATRKRQSLATGRAWDPADEQGRPLDPVPTPEWKRPSLSSVYALTKYAQEQLTLIVAPAYGMEGVALRLFNVFGPGHALSNPYTGVLAIFASRLLNKKPPLVFEDGEQRRDFVHVTDVARAFVLALDTPEAAGDVFNIGSGIDVSIAEVGRRLARAMNREELTPEILGKARVGDIRHCFADITKARRVLGFEPRQQFDQGLTELAAWVASQTAEDRIAEAKSELELRGLVS